MAGLQRQADLVFLNQGGFEAAAGQAADAGLLQAALCRQGRARIVVVTPGAGGALAAERDEGIAHPAARPAEVVDSTGAGETCNTTLLVARDRGAALATALQLACRSAACPEGTFGAPGALADLAAADAGPPQAERVGEGRCARPSTPSSTTPPRQPPSQPFARPTVHPSARPSPQPSPGGGESVRERPVGGPGVI